MEVENRDNMTSFEGKLLKSGSLEVLNSGRVVMPLITAADHRESLTNGSVESVKAASIESYIQ